MRVTAPLSYAQGGEQVQDMMEHGVSFPQVEEAINTSRLSREHKAALWLLAWSLRQPPHQRRDARLMLGLDGAGGWSGP